MVANELLKQYKSLPDYITNYVGVEDFPDRLNFLFTVTILMVCCSVVTVRTYVFHPLACYVPNAFGAGSAGQELFVNNYCWTEGTYAVHPKHFSIDATLPDGGLGRYKDKRITYYQWVPLVLGVQCILFYLPRVLWGFVNNQRSGTDVTHIVRTVQDASKADAGKHDRLMQHACKRLEQLLQRSHQLSRCKTIRALQSVASSRCGLALSSQSQGNTIILCYLGIKLVYFVNASGQLVLMQHFLNLNSSEYRLFGLRLLSDLSGAVHWENSMTFPRVGSCAVYMKTSGQGNWQFSQCALPINMINEKIYIFLWFWIAFVAATTAISLIAWAVRIYSNRRGSSFVRRYLKLADNYGQLRNNPWLKKFELEFLRNDGTFLLKMIALNCGDVACTELLRGLWQNFLRANGLQRSAASSGGGGGVTVKSLVVIPTTGMPERALTARPESRAVPTAPPQYYFNDNDGDGKPPVAAAVASADKRNKRLTLQRSISTA